MTSLKFRSSLLTATGVTSLKLFQFLWSDWSDLAQILKVRGYDCKLERLTL